MSTKGKRPRGAINFIEPIRAPDGDAMMAKIYHAIAS
jgi:hypothetical protein